MNTQALKDMRTLLQEVEAGTWQPTLEKEGVEDWLEGFGEPRGFNINSWGEELQDIDGPCGFTACAVGHAALDRRFPWLTAYPHYGEMQVVVEGEEDLSQVMAALAENFGIEVEQVNKLFLPEFYGNRLSDSTHVTPRDVITRINLLLNGEEI